MLMTYAFPMDLTPDDNDTVLVTCPDIPELTTFGETEEDALTHAADALVAALNSYIEDGRPIPMPSARPGLPLVPVPTRAALKIALAEALRESGMTQQELAARLGMDGRQVRRMLDLTQRGLRPDDFDRALLVLGKRPVLHLDAA